MSVMKISSVFFSKIPEILGALFKFPDDPAGKLEMISPVCFMIWMEFKSSC